MASRSFVVEGDFNIVPFAPALSLPSRTSNGKDEMHKCTHRQGSVLFLMWLHSSWLKVMIKCDCYARFNMGSIWRSWLSRGFAFRCSYMAVFVTYLRFDSRPVTNYLYI